MTDSGFRFAKLFEMADFAVPPFGVGGLKANYFSPWMVSITLLDV